MRMITMTLLLLLCTANNNNNNNNVEASLVNCVVTLPDEGESAIEYASCYDFEVDAPGSDALYCRSKQDCETVLLYFGSSSSVTQVVEVEYDAWIPVLTEEDLGLEKGRVQVQDRKENDTGDGNTTTTTTTVVVVTHTTVP